MFLQLGATFKKFKDLPRITKACKLQMLLHIGKDGQTRSERELQQSIKLQSVHENKNHSKREDKLGP
ncbi:hypothetical protein Hanom_Chr10g00931221 [Helianthus anomalus]